MGGEHTAGDAVVVAQEGEVAAGEEGVGGGGPELGRGGKRGGHGKGGEEVWEKVGGRGGGEVGDRRRRDRDRLPCHSKMSSRVKNRSMSAPCWMKYRGGFGVGVGGGAQFVRFGKFKGVECLVFKFSGVK